MPRLALGFPGGITLDCFPSAEVETPASILFPTASTGIFFWLLLSWDQGASWDYLPLPVASLLRLVPLKASATIFRSVYATISA